MKFFNLAVCCSVCLLPSTLFADFTMFEIQPFFETAAADNGNFLAAMEDFEGNNLGIDQAVLLPPTGVLEFGQPLIGKGGLGFTNGSSTDLITIDAFEDGIGNTWALFNDDGNGDISFGTGIEIFMNEPVSAFGLDLDNFFSGLSTPVELIDTNGDIVYSNNFESIAGFLGFVATDGDLIGSVRIGQQGGGRDIPTIDNLQVWQAVPEPNAAFAAIFVSLFGLERKRRPNLR